MVILYIYISAFSRRLRSKRLTVHSGYTCFVSMCVPWKLNPQPFVLLTQWATGTVFFTLSDSLIGNDIHLGVLFVLRYHRDTSTSLRCHRANRCRSHRTARWASFPLAFLLFLLPLHASFLFPIWRSQGHLHLSIIIPDLPVLLRSLAEIFLSSTRFWGSWVLRVLDLNRIM